ncbi:hypothetical protein LPJ61_001217 [Coemansia biformis]|uniref:Uncharacterized protein n=1 Tax=Coemansia biformis TaxID=1286918 RepID=A0A9W8CYB7_9FUNG|nr:hypothetical protein LPJ61_001217 [Coemansia biformis]
MVLETHSPHFEGTELLNPAATWCVKAAAAIRNYAPGVEPSLLAKAVLKLLTGCAKAVASTLSPAMPEDIFAVMRDQFPTTEHEHHVLRAIDTGAMWAGIEVTHRPVHLHRIFDMLPMAMYLYANTFVQVLFSLNASIFGMMAVNPAQVTAATFGKVCDKFALCFQIVGPAKSHQQGHQQLAPACPAAPAVQPAVAIGRSPGRCAAGGWQQR